MKRFRSTLSVCVQNFRKWQTDYRVWCIAVLLIIMTGVYVSDMRRICDYAGTKMPLWIFPFLYSQFYMKLIFTLPVALLFCSAPFTDANQTFVFMRTGRIKWLLSQMIYIISASAVYYLFLLFLSLLMTVFTGEKTLGWGETLPMIAASGDTGINHAAGAYFVTAPYIITEFFTPLRAIGYTFLMSWLGAVILGLVIFCFNLITGVRAVGVLISSLLIIISGVIENSIENWDWLMPFSPISWITLDNIDVGGLTKNPTFIYCLSVDIGIIAALSAVILIFGRKKSLDIKE